jgi:hypothetical protein
MSVLDEDGKSGSLGSGNSGDLIELKSCVLEGMRIYDNMR